ncbi:MAG: HEAT repeat domain-containing protein [Anaerolineae bacterium]
MSNRKVLEAAAEHRRKMRPQAKRAYRKYGAQARDLIRQLDDPTQKEHDYAFDRLSRMGEFVASELLKALADPTLDPITADEVVSLLGTIGDESARKPVWQFLQANQGDPERVSTAALSLAGLGDDRALPYLRTGLDADDEEQVANSIAAMIMLGQMEDIPRLRQAHHRHRANREICLEAAHATLTILGETNQRTFNRTLDEIRTSFADRHLWADIWAILESQFGSPQHPVH